MSLHPPLNESNRFTITDYQYDSDSSFNHNHYDTSSEAGPSRLVHSPEIAAPTAIPPAIIQERRRRKQGSGSSNGSTNGTTGKLRLHQPTDRPTYPPRSVSSSSLFAHPISPSTDYNPYTPIDARDVVRPLPSIPRSFSSDQGMSSPGTPPIMSPPLRSPSLSSPQIERTPSPSGGLSPPPNPHRTSDVSANWSTHDNGYSEKDKEAGPPVLTTVGTNAETWWEKIFPASLSCRLLMLTVVLESIIDLTIEGNILWRFDQEIDHSDAASVLYRRMPVYLVIYGLAHLWQLVLTFVAVRSKNTVQITAVTAFNFAFLAYAVMQIFELRQILGDDLADELTSPRDSDETSLLTLPLNVLTAVVIAVVATGCIILLILSYCIRREFGWQRYRFLGADLQIRKYYLRFQVYECICYFSAFFCAGFGIQFIWLVLQKTDSEYIITWIAFPVLILLLVLGRFAAKYENRIAMGVFMVGLVVSWAYFVFKLVRVWQQENTTYYHLTKSLTGFAVLSLISLFACFGWGVRVWMDFGKGLKSAVLNQQKGTSLHSVVGLWSTRSKTSEVVQETPDLAQRRISID